jgi:hypothetical protein
MRDIDEFMASYQNHQKALAEANAINKNAAFDALAAAGIATVNVESDGEGDSGQNRDHFGRRLRGNSANPYRTAEDLVGHRQA